jgi:hypothetical protein
MNKLLTILLAGTFAAGAAVAGTSAGVGAKAGVNTGDLGSSNTASGTGSTAAGTNHTTTADKRAAKSGSSSLDAKGAANDTSTLGAAGDATVCPPGLDKKDNNCTPPGQLNKADKSMSKDKTMHSGKAEGERAQDKTTTR